MKNQIKRIRNNVQNRESEAWKKLCEYIDELAESERDEFSPREKLGDKLFSEIYTLPESIAKLKKVTKVWLYGSNLKRIPPEIGEMDSLEHFDPYTSYDLNWLPYEITKCKNLKQSRISTRALFGNYKHRKPFPKLHHNPVIYDGKTLYCSICEKEITQDTTEQYWISLNIATDVVPLLVNTCSEKCKSNLPKPPKGYITYAHKGGADQEQPKEDPRTLIDYKTKKKLPLNPDNKKEIKDLKPLKLVRKIWER